MIETIHQESLCIGCGLCAASCPTEAIEMHWTDEGIDVPDIGDSRCTQCGLCLKVCPNNPERLVERAICAQEAGPAFGVPREATACFAHHGETTARADAASGGALTAILSSLLSSGEIDGVIGPRGVPAQVGQPHVECVVHRDVDSIKAAASSHYHPVNYAQVLREIADGPDGKYALLGLPCTMRSLELLPKKIRSRIAYTFCLICSHNATARFTDCLAMREGINPDEPFQCDLRHKNRQMENASRYLNRFSQGEKEICRNRFETDFTVLWREHFFGIEACLYCPDFYGIEADCSVKDPWGVRNDPAGWSLTLIRNPRLAELVEQFAKKGEVVIEPCTLATFLHSQSATAIYKARDAIIRHGMHPRLRQQAKENGKSGLLGSLSRAARAGRRQRWIIRRSNKEYSLHGADLPVRRIARIGYLLYEPDAYLDFLLQKIKRRFTRIYNRHLRRRFQSTKGLAHNGSDNNSSPKEKDSDDQNE